MIFALLLAALAALSLALNLWQWFVARRFPLHQRTGPSDFAPPVTLLKPVKGCDAETRECLRSWFRQDYPGPVQILFGIADENDAAAAVVKELIAQYPAVKAELLICHDLLGANAKVSKLAQLMRHAEHQHVVISDADVRVPKDFLREALAPLRDPAVGLVNCFYRLANPSTPAMRWEAVAINADFWSQVLQSRSLKPLDFALGAAMATRREQLAAIGGFEALVDYLADDYQLGHQIARTGKRIELCPVVVECWDPPMNWRAVWAHQLRWARTIRVCQPVAYFFSILSNATFWPLLLVLAFPNWTLSFNAPPPNGASGAGLHLPVSHLILLVCLIYRWGIAASLQCRLTDKPVPLLQILMAPMKDLLHVAVWAAAFLGNEVVWRGVRYRVLPGGKLRRVSDG